eukprot:CAMPEP_0194360298 /NCGR_PEP_ID=MMETSP0174-20130528/7600_1 /TAXON_ID=216777 /ORGANISM="Proboscia alata, Strain PI-D3" /LENGTH=48 /DNA_ID= /DNA_START= /DNA_END= /DNA_ORIENTATION=
MLGGTGGGTAVSASDSSNTGGGLTACKTSWEESAADMDWFKTLAAAAV